MLSKALQQWVAAGRGPGVGLRVRRLTMRLPTDAQAEVLRGDLGALGVKLTVKAGVEPVEIRVIAGMVLRAAGYPGALRRRQRDVQARS